MQAVGNAWNALVPKAVEVAGAALTSATNAVAKTKEEFQTKYPAQFAKLEGLWNDFTAKATAAGASLQGAAAAVQSKAAGEEDKIKATISDAINKVGSALQSYNVMATEAKEKFPEEVASMKDSWTSHEMDAVAAATGELEKVVGGAPPDAAAPTPVPAATS
mmetsp:Transcript_3810/g.8223  ORF Transcript_3810/g.8223 Transcript_3810/m.8223 type:complete len:162 (-) Transcript_3810:185-670(-)|eukprot:CAMPEP_0178610728 /NCGR_PEP_ID=MMETSP0698-20121128/245_1 /TAXON_ID=265572 /ORGANISM="Extubocellulus spinifer, Strain CCMP396" /LENGTH=161 /DNA_ID=CAMNT_0020249335 /DNA_START=59 /DNA_END=544 /DNA_ORIENTATION=+